MRTRLGFKVLGLSALVLGVMAIGTAGMAQAEVGACWSLINPTTKVLECFPSTLEPKLLFAIENNTATMLIENTNLEILCTTAAWIEGGQLGPEGSVLLGKILFGGCVGLSRTPELKILPKCTPTDPIDGVGTMVTEKIKGLIKLHLGEPTILFSPDTGEILKKIFLPKCAVAEEIIVKGELVIHDCGLKKGFEEHKLTHLFEEYTSLQLIKVGVNKATIDGSVNVTLGEPHNTLLWGGHAG